MTIIQVCVFCQELSFLLWQIDPNNLAQSTPSSLSNKNSSSVQKKGDSKQSLADWHYRLDRCASLSEQAVRADETSRSDSVVRSDISPPPSVPPPPPPALNARPTDQCRAWRETDVYRNVSPACLSGWQGASPPACLPLTSSTCSKNYSALQRNRLGGEGSSNAARGFEGYKGPRCLLFAHLERNLWKHQFEYII